MDGIDTKEEIQAKANNFKEYYEENKTKEKIVGKSDELKIVKIFLASSSELTDDRNEFEKFIGRKNKELVKENIFLELVIWEDFCDVMSQKRLQDEYNKTIKECSIFVMLFWTKVGKYTLEEFETAYGQFKKSDRPLVYTYFKHALIDSGALELDDLRSVKEFQTKLKELGHFQTVYKSSDDLKFKFSNQLEKVLSQI